MSAAQQIDWSKYEPPQQSSAPPQIDFSKYETRTTAGQPQPRTWADSVGDFGSELWKQINPVSAVKGLAQVVEHPVDTFKSDADARQSVYDSAEQEFKKGDYVGGSAKLLYSVLPLIGPQLDAAGNNFVQGNYAKGAGASTGMGLAMAGPAAAAKVIPAAADAISGVAPRMYQSALKPSRTIPADQTAAIVQTGLKEGIPVSQAGVEKLGYLIDDLNDKISQTIQADPTRPISPTAVAARTQGLESKFANQVNPEADLNAIAASREEFLRNRTTQPLTAGQQGPANLAPIDAADAQTMKQGTYRQLSSKAYGELQSATIESQKALARGLKQELANAFPELSNLNARDAQLLDLQEPLEKAVQRIGNHQLIGIGTPIAVGAGKALTGSSAVGAATGALKAVLDNPIVKSRLAIALSKAGNMPPATALGRIAAYQGGLDEAGAAAANTAPPADRTSQ